MLEDELEELEALQKDLCALSSVAQMTASYPAWGGDADMVRVVACTLASMIDRLRDATEGIRRECRKDADAQQECSKLIT